MGSAGFFIQQAPPGLWQWRVSAVSATSIDTDFEIWATVDNALSVLATQNKDVVGRGDSLVLQVSITQESVGISGMNVTALPIRNDVDTGAVISFADDGQHMDGSASDGVYGAIISSFSAGVYTFHVTVQGATPLGSVMRLLEVYVYAKEGCCSGRVGNANGLGTYPQEVTISDIQTLVTAKFIQVTCNGLVSCNAEADANQSGGANPTCSDITISDIQTLVNHLFIAGPANAPLKDCL
jgi:hypothetical protein